MLDIAIVGGGLCGLKLANTLRREQLSYALFEARTRLGGRILSQDCERAGLAVDLGAAWLWPGTQRRIVALVDELGLKTFAQHDTGSVLVLGDPEKGPQRQPGAVHGDAHRVEGGTDQLVRALGAALEPQAVKLGHRLLSVRDLGSHVELKFQCGADTVTVGARRVVLAMPPRVVAESVRFDPQLDGDVQDALQNTVTWMAAQAKAVVGFERALWRDAGQSGNAFVTHDQAVLGEVYDACDASGGKAALGGFVALPPKLRLSFGPSLPLLVGNQLEQIFGPQLEDGQLHYQDWAAEPFTCTSVDRETPVFEHTGIANPILRRAHWADKLHFGGSETASEGAGYLEGALEAAERLERTLLPELAGKRGAGQVSTTAENASVTPGMPSNEASLERFRAWVEARRKTAFDTYRQLLHRSLSSQQADQLTQRAVLGVMEALYDDALAELKQLPFDTDGVAIERGRSALMPYVQAPFLGFIKELMNDVVVFNRTSCALSNFPHEHHVSDEYMQTMARDIAAAWQEFLLGANEMLLARASRRKSAASELLA